MTVWTSRIVKWASFPSSSSQTGIRRSSPKIEAASCSPSVQSQSTSSKRDRIHRTAASTLQTSTVGQVFVAIERPIETRMRWDSLGVMDWFCMTETSYTGAKRSARVFCNFFSGWGKGPVLLGVFDVSSFNAKGRTSNVLGCSTGNKWET